MKHLLNFGVGFSPGEMSYIVTMGFGGAPNVVSVPGLRSRLRPMIHLLRRGFKANRFWP